MGPRSVRGHGGGGPVSHRAGAAGGYTAIAETAAALAERTGLLGLASAWAARQLVARYFVAGFTDEAQRVHWVPRLADGACAAVAISEPGVGAHPKHLTTRAVSDGDGVRLTGEKAWVYQWTNGRRVRGFRDHGGGRHAQTLQRVSGAA